MLRIIEPNKNISNLPTYVHLTMRFVKDFYKDGYIIRLYDGEDGSYTIDYGKSLASPKRKKYNNLEELKKDLQPRLGDIEIP